MHESVFVLKILYGKKCVFLIFLFTAWLSTSDSDQRGYGIIEFLYDASSHILNAEIEKLEKNFSNTDFFIIFYLYDLIYQTKFTESWYFRDALNSHHWPWIWIRPSSRALKSRANNHF